MYIEYIREVEKQVDTVDSWTLDGNAQTNQTVFSAMSIGRMDTRGHRSGGIFYCGHTQKIVYWI